ncbi:hypothetical protein C4K88_04145 [Arthrobacter pityocampae]|uniref:UmuC domain-containing protein n=1 Tax=Arthrobacter pityocampae TaxID=547334 RepID=A0A2S5IZA2_9MICC|nr:hypothetical protein [Arthrobacter pityocampae]PPB49889.1 hypothetical protein C4K88_04145 [Arthrobacter pityocampae]
MSDQEPSDSRVALVDVNNFYVSSERAFDPSLEDKSLVVLSNDDGCVITRSAEAKSLVIPMGAPWFQIADQAKGWGLQVRSSNYELYGDMSARVMEILGRHTTDLEIYSIDEAFLTLHGTHGDQRTTGRTIKTTVRRNTGLPVCVGLAPTKTRRLGRVLVDSRASVQPFSPRPVSGSCSTLCSGALSSGVRHTRPTVVGASCL